MGNGDSKDLDITEVMGEVSLELDLRRPEDYHEALASLPQPLEHLGRYRVLHTLGKGGMGYVVASDDPWLNRQVAIKLMHSRRGAEQRILRRFAREAQVTAQLEHPYIVPVYDIGTDSKGQLFFAMRRVSGLSLAEIIQALQQEEKEVHRKFSRIRLLNIFQKVCMAVAYAHNRRVIHRDLKPDNVMVGEHGEVYVMDWGLCRVIGSHAGEETARINLPDPVLDTFQSSVERVQGTPIYMAPEDLSGTGRRGSVSADIYSLGAILYELLTHRPLFADGTLLELIARATIGGVIPPRKRAPETDIPEALEAIVLKALNLDPMKRHASALELHAEIEEFLAGTAERSRREAASQRAVQDGLKKSTSFETYLHKIRDCELELYLARLKTGPTEDTSGYDEIYRLGKQLEALEEKSVDSLSSAARSFEEALSHDPTNAEARAHLARLYWSRFTSAELRGNKNNARYFRRLVEIYNDGQFDAPLSGEGVFRLQTDPNGATATLQEFIDTNGLLSLGSEKELGTTPLEISPISMGSYLVTLRLDGFRTTRVPFLVERQARPNITVRLRTEKEVGLGFVHIPGGPFVVGGDPLNPPAGPRRVEIVADFAIAEYPVTVSQYLDFVNDIAKLDSSAAATRAPRLENGEPLWSQSRDGQFHLPKTETDGGGIWYPACPVTRITWHDAMAYCSWGARRARLPLRLPTSGEWEKAARGVDGRVYPWGSRFDPEFCNMSESRTTHPKPEPLGTFEIDSSPYGVRDMAGGAAEWCGGWFDAARNQQPLRGLGFEATEFECRLTYVRGHRPDRLLHFAGFRLAHSFDWTKKG